MHAHELSAENDFCDTCKLVITEAASILGNLVRNICLYWQLLCGVHVLGNVLVPHKANVQVQQHILCTPCHGGLARAKLYSLQFCLHC